jgi:hypothetical protein
VEVLGDVMAEPVDGVVPERVEAFAHARQQLAGVGHEDHELGRVLEQRLLEGVVERVSFGVVGHQRDRPSFGRATGCGP